MRYLRTFDLTQFLGHLVWLSEKREFLRGISEPTARGASALIHSQLCHDLSLLNVQYLALARMADGW